MFLDDLLTDFGPRFRVPLGAIRTGLRYGRMPLFVSWIVTNRCNLRCVYCGCPHIKTAELSTEQALRLVTEMADLGVLAVHITGGEPLVRKDLDRIVSRLRSTGVRFGISTNGTLVPKRQALFEGCSSVSLSLDGPPIVHDQHRKTGQVAEVLDACRVLSSMDVETRLVSLVTRNTTTDSMRFVMEQAQVYGAKVYFQPALDVVLSTTDENPVVAQSKKVNALFSDLIDFKTAGKPIGNSVASLKHMARWPHQEPLRCMLQRVAVRVDPQGVLLPCHERADAPDGVSVLDGGFGSALSSLKSKSCTECWGSSRVQARESFRANPAELISLAGTMLGSQSAR